MYEERKYRKPFLVEVLARLDFTGRVDQFLVGLPSPLVSTVLKNFPIMEPQEKEVVEIEGQAPLFKAGPNIFRSSDRNRRMVITPMAMFLDDNKYESFERFENEFTPVVERVFADNPDLMVRRFGLRYINKVHDQNGNVHEWDKYIKPEFLTVFSVSPEKKNLLARALHNLTWNLGDMILNFNYGIYNPDFPSPINQKEFIFDFDAYYEGAMKLEEIGPKLDRCHQQIQELFESCITDELRTKMEVVNAG